MLMILMHLSAGEPSASFSTVRRIQAEYEARCQRTIEQERHSQAADARSIQNALLYPQPSPVQALRVQEMIGSIVDALKGSIQRGFERIEHVRAFFESGQHADANLGQRIRAALEHAEAQMRRSRSGGMDPALQDYFVSKGLLPEGQEASPDQMLQAYIQVRNGRPISPGRQDWSDYSDDEISAGEAQRFNQERAAADNHWSNGSQRSPRTRHAPSAAAAAAAQSRLASSAPQRTTRATRTPSREISAALTQDEVWKAYQKTQADRLLAEVKKFETLMPTQINNAETIKNYAGYGANIAIMAAQMAHAMGSDLSRPLANVAYGAFGLEHAFSNILKNGADAFSVGNAFCSAVSIVSALIDDHDDEPNPFQELATVIIKAIQESTMRLGAMLVKLSVQMDSHFHHMERLMVGHHAESMGVINRVLPTLQQGFDNLSALTKQQHQETMQALKAVSQKVDASLEAHKQNALRSLTQTYELQQEIYYLGTLLDERFVRRIKAMQPTEVKAQFDALHHDLTHMILNESAGAPSMTGKDINISVADDKVIARVIQPLRAHASPEMVAAYNLNAMLRWAFQNEHAFDWFPHLMLLKSRVLALKKMYAQIKDQETYPMSQKEHDALKKVIDFVINVNETIRIANPSMQFPYYTGLLGGALNALKAQISAFEAAHHHEGEAQAQNVKALRVHHVRNLMAQQMGRSIPFTMPYENQYFTVRFDSLRMSHHYYGDGGVCAKLGLPRAHGNAIAVYRNTDCGFATMPPFLQAAVSSLPSIHPAQKGGANRFFRCHMANESVGEISSGPQSWSTGHVFGDDNLRNVWLSRHVDGDKLRASVTGNVQVSEQQYKARYAARILAILGEIDAIAESIALGSRVFECSGRQPLYLNGAFLTHIIPQEVWQAEQKGLGQVKLSYSVHQPNANMLALTLKGEFQKGAELPIALFSYDYACPAAPVYKDLEEVIHNIWYSERIYTGERIDLSCAILTHDTPVYVHSNVPNPVFDGLQHFVNPNVAHLTQQFQGMLQAHEAARAQALQQRIASMNFNEVDRVLSMIQLWIPLLAPSSQFSFPDLKTKNIEDLKTGIEALLQEAAHFVPRGSNDELSVLIQELQDVERHVVMRASQPAVAEQLQSVRQENADLKQQLATMQATLNAILARLPQ